jgi:hypothetical protein
MLNVKTRPLDLKDADGLLDEDKDVSGVQAELKYSVETEKKNEKQGGIFHSYINFLGGLSHVHVDDDPQVVKHRDEAGQDSDDHQRHKTLSDSRREDIKLC